MMGKRSLWKNYFEYSLQNLIDTFNLDPSDHVRNKHYFLNKGKIVYKNQDVVVETTMGYRTQAAYLRKFELGEREAKVFDDNIFLIMRLGSFSYVEFSSRFSCILGVTGSLDRKEYIKQDYGIQLFTEAPSVFGENRLIFELNSHVRLSNKMNL